MKITSPLVTIIILAALITPAAWSEEAEPTAPERFRGRIASIGGPFGGQTAYVTLQADRYTSDDEVMRLAKILIDDGEKALSKALSDVEPAGWIRIGDNTRYHLRVVRTHEVAGGRLIRAVTDRPIFYGEIIRPTRSSKYSFGMIEIYMENDEDGSGAILPAAKIQFNNGTVEVESLGTQPFQVLNVKPEEVQNKK